MWSLYVLNTASVYPIRQTTQVEEERVGGTNQSEICERSVPIRDYEYTLTRFEQSITQTIDKLGKIL